MAPPSWQLCCPVSYSADAEKVTLAHGEGGRLMRQLIEQKILPRFAGAEAIGVPGDAALLWPVEGRLAFTTDSYVVSPLFFPGGDIGRLAVFGTVNDLLVAGATPLCLSLSLIVEEGLPMAVLERVLDSIAAAAHQARVRVVTGDTKVVPSGAADGLFINTSGVGQVLGEAPPGPASLQVGDELIVTGPIGRHGIAILSAREELGFSPAPESDCACLEEPVRCLADAGLLGGAAPRVRAMRDATRGGVTAVLHEWAQACGQTLTIREEAVPTAADTRGAAEVLGLDPLYIACEGTMLIGAAGGSGPDVIAALRSARISSQAAVIGEVCASRLSPVTIRRPLGREQPLDEPSGALLPRIC